MERRSPRRRSAASLTIDWAAQVQAHAAKWQTLQEDVQAWMEEQDKLCGMFLAAPGLTSPPSASSVAQEAARGGVITGAEATVVQHNVDSGVVPARNVSTGQLFPSSKSGHLLTSRNGSKTNEVPADGHRPPANHIIITDSVCGRGSFDSENQEEVEFIEPRLADSCSAMSQEESPTAGPSGLKLNVVDQAEKRSCSSESTPQSPQNCKASLSSMTGDSKRTRDLESDLARMDKQKDWVQVRFAKLAGRFDDFLDKLNDDIPKDTCLRRIVFSGAFEWLTSTVILANALVMVLSTDYAIENPSNPEHDVYDTLELSFTLFYSLEILLRIVASGWAFLLTEDWRWNVVDVFLVVNALYDQASSRFLEGGRGVNISFMRVTRLLKITRLLRTVRIFRMFRELRLIVSSMLGCARTMVWSVVLIVLTTYIFGLCFTQAGFTYLQTEEGEHPGLDARIREYYGSTSKSMLTLYMAASNGASWREFDETLQEVGGVYHIIFLVYIAFFMLTVANTMTALFIDSTQALADKDDNTLIREELSRRKKFIAKMKTLWQQLDVNQSGSMEKDDAQLRLRLRTKEMLSFANSLELDPLDMEEFFNVLSDGGHKPVDAESFIMGCFKLKGNARSLDLVSVMHMVKEMKAREKHNWAVAMRLLEGIHGQLRGAYPSNISDNSEAHRLPHLEAHPVLRIQNTFVV